MKQHVLGDFVQFAYGRDYLLVTGNKVLFLCMDRQGLSAPNEAILRGPGIVVGRKGNVGSVYWCKNDCLPSTLSITSRPTTARHISTTPYYILSSSILMSQFLA